MLDPLDQMASEIKRLKGELSAATWAIGYLFEILIGLGGGGELRDTLVRKISEAGHLASDDDWGEGVRCFDERLLKHLETY